MCLKTVTNKRISSGKYGTMALFLKNRRGSYIIEAAIVLPVFLIAVIVMSSVILMYACIENCNFMTAAEMRKCAAEAIYTDTYMLMPYRLKKKKKKTHTQGFLTAASTSGVLNTTIKKKYKSCPLCGSGKAKKGSRIYYFPSAGEDYHLPGCSALQRNYIEIDKRDAIERGYTPCSKCGG